MQGAELEHPIAQGHLAPPEGPLVEAADGPASKKQRTWLRHKWSDEHDAALLNSCIKNNAHSKKFGDILKRWENVSKDLSTNYPIFHEWGNLKVDMLRRRYDKRQGELWQVCRTKGAELISENDVTDSMTELEGLAFKIHNLVKKETADDATPSAKKKAKPSTPKLKAARSKDPETQAAIEAEWDRKQEETIRDTVETFLSKAVRVDELTVDSIRQTDLTNGQVDLQAIITSLLKQNDQLIDLTTSLLAKQLNPTD